MKAVKLAQRCSRSFRIEAVPYPPGDWARSRDSFRRVLDRLSIDCVLDVGGDRGGYGDLLRDIGYKGWIISFEPVRAFFEVLSKCANEFESKGFSVADFIPITKVDDLLMVEMDFLLTRNAEVQSAC